MSTNTKIDRCPVCGSFTLAHGTTIRCSFIMCDWELSIDLSKAPLKSVETKDGEKKWFVVLI